MILECKNICKTYIQGKLEFPVLKNINLQIDEGEYVAIIGPSGSGKSTLMNLLGCLDQATSGELLLDGQDVSKCSDNELADIRLQKIGFVFQNFQLLAYQSALENVELPLTYAGKSRKERREMATAALERVGLGDRLHFKPNQLSGGQKQRVAIARAIVNHPKVLLADEPTGALDSKSGKQVMELFEELNRDGVTVLMITHDHSIADRAQRKVEIRDGELTHIVEPVRTEAVDAEAEAEQLEEPGTESVEIDSAYIEVENANPTDTEVDGDKRKVELSAEADDSKMPKKAGDEEVSE